MILLFGGTTEGKSIASDLDACNLQYLYSTKTKVNFDGNGKSIYGALTSADIEQLCITHNVKCIINAAHPFAKQLHDTIAQINLNIPLFRFERAFTERVNHKLVHYVDSFNDALGHLKHNNYKSLLALSGVQTIHKLSEYWNKHTTWFRILDREVSRSIARDAGFPLTHLIFGLPQDYEDEILLFKTIKPSVIFTKESGINGKLDHKIKAACLQQIPIVILKRPLLSNRYLCMTSRIDLVQTVIQSIE